MRTYGKAQYDYIIFELPLGVSKSCIVSSTVPKVNLSGSSEIFNTGFHFNLGKFGCPVVLSTSSWCPLFRKKLRLWPVWDDRQILLNVPTWILGGFDILFPSLYVRVVLIFRWQYSHKLRF